MSDLLEGFKEHQAFTDPQSPDPRLRGRTYAIPFETVWQGLIGLGGGGMSGWDIESADDQQGLINAAVSGGVLRPEIVVRIRVGLDENAQTRVDLAANTRSERGDFGRSRRVIDSFTKRLDQKLGADEAHILDPTRISAYGADA